MTQKEKLMKAFLFCQKVKRIAEGLKEESKSYDVRFPVPMANELIEESDKIIKILK